LESSAVSESALPWQLRGLLFDRSRLRSFASGKTNEVFYVPFGVLRANWRPRERTVLCIERRTRIHSTRKRFCR